MVLVLQGRQSGAESRGCRGQEKGRGKLLGSRRELEQHGECRALEEEEEEEGESKELEQESRVWGQVLVAGSPHQ